MRVITRSRLKVFWNTHPQAKEPLNAWYMLMRTGGWKTFVELRAIFPSADQVGHHTVFNIGGNKYRLIAAIHYNTQLVFVRFVLTHADYDLGKWKTD